MAMTTATWRMLSPPFLRASAELFDRCCGARCGKDFRLLAHARLQRHASIHDRQHAPGSVDMVCRFEDISVLGTCGSQEYSGLHADEDGRDSAAAPDHGSLPESHHRSRSPVACAGCG